MSFTIIYFFIYFFQKAQSAVYVHRYFYHYRKVVHSSLTHTYTGSFLAKRLRLFETIQSFLNEHNDTEAMICLYNRIALDLLGNILVELLAGDSFFVTRKRVKQNILQNPLYAEALSRLDISCMPLHWKMFYWFGKRKKCHYAAVDGQGSSLVKEKGLIGVSV